MADPACLLALGIFHQSADGGGGDCDFAKARSGEPQCAAGHVDGLGAMVATLGLGGMVSGFTASVSLGRAILWS